MVWLIVVVVKVDAVLLEVGVIAVVVTLSVRIVVGEIVL